jgi:NAD(P)-dependent dehydrogenase (short-subunit alcohol dehydrogenase family)
MPTVLITGANRGIGREFVRQYAAAGWRVHAVARHAGDLPGSDNVQVHLLDVTDGLAVKALASDLQAEAIDLLIANAGIFGTGGGVGLTDYASWEEVMRVNVLAPMRFAETFANHIAASQGRTFAAISSGMGSIAEDTSGGCYAYRSSKAALNMVVHNLAIDLKGRIRTVSLCPGWVKTDMGGTNAELDVQDSVRDLIKVLAGIDDAKSGRYFSHTGREVAW